MAIAKARVSVLLENLGLGQDELVGFSKEDGSSSNSNSVNMGGEGNLSPLARSFAVSMEGLRSEILAMGSQGAASAFNLHQSRWSDIVEMEGGEEAVIDSFKDILNSLVVARARNLVSKLNQQPNEISLNKIGGKLDLSADIPWASGAQSSRGQ